MKPIKIYLSARISKDAHEWNEKVCGVLRSPFEIFQPHQHNPWNIAHEKLERHVYQTDLDAMIASDMGLLLPPYGRDCAWETGWYACSEKPLVVFASGQTEWLRDWMVKGGVDHVITDDAVTYAKLSSDQILRKEQITFIPTLSDLHRALLSFYKEHAASKDLQPA